MSTIGKPAGPAPVVAKSATPAAASQEKKPKGVTGRKSQYAGKKLFKKVKENPRRKDTWGWKSWEILKDGMAYEDYLMAGGRLKDLDWDISKGNIEVK